MRDVLFLHNDELFTLRSINILTFSQFALCAWTIRESDNLGIESRKVCPQKRNSHFTQDNPEIVQVLTLRRTYTP